MAAAQGRIRRTPPLPDTVVYKIFQHLPTTSLFTASLVCSRWRRLLYHSGPLSQALLKPHLSVLRERFGQEEVPPRLPIPTVRKLLVLYARQTLFGSYSSTVTYDISNLVTATSLQDTSSPIPQQRRRFAVCGSLLAFSMRKKRVRIFETDCHPIRPLTTIHIPCVPTAIALSESFLAILDESRVHLYHLLARGTANFVAIQVYSIEVPKLQNPSAIAITPEGVSPPLVAVLGTDLYLIHPSHALSQKRHGFFRSGSGIGAKEPAVDEKGKTSHEEQSAPSTEWILTAPGTTVGVSFPITFTMRGRQLNVSTAGARNYTSQRTAYLGSAWGNESPQELERRRRHGLKDGQNLLSRNHDADALFRHYRARTAGSARNPVRKWTPKHFNTGEMEIEDAVHVWDSYYVVTECATGCVRIISVAPFESRCLLYRRNANFEERGRRHCGYSVFQGTKIVNGRRVGGYIAFSPSEGRLKVLPLENIPWFQDVEDKEDYGWELVKECRDIAVGAGDILGMFAGSERVTVVFENRIVLVILWTRKIGGVEDEENEWAIDKHGRVHNVWDWKGSFGCLDGARCSIV